MFLTFLKSFAAPAQEIRSNFPIRDLRLSFYENESRYSELPGFGLYGSWIYLKIVANDRLCDNWKTIGMTVTLGAIFWTTSAMFSAFCLSLSNK